METKPELCCAFLQHLDAVQDRPDVDAVQFLILYEFGRVAVQQGQRQVAAPYRLMSQRLRVPHRTYQRKLASIHPELLLPIQRKGRQGGNLFDVAYLGNLLKNDATVASFFASQPKECSQDGVIPPEMTPQWRHSDQAQESAQTQSVEELTAKCSQDGVISGSVDIDIVGSSTYVEVIGRVLSTDSQDIEGPIRTELKKHLWGYMHDHGELRTAPDAKIVSEIAQIAPLPDLLRWLEELHREGRHRPQSYAWFRSVALQRFHGIPPKESYKLIKQMVKRKQPQSEIGSNRDISDQAIRALATAKAM